MSDQNALMVTDQAELSIEEVKIQVQKIQQLMKSVMREGEHYGTIPGTNKPSLYKAGAEKLGFTFRLMPDFKITRRDLPDGHREYDIVCTLKHMQSGKVVGQGVGNCSTLESKYRYRYSEENTGKPLPKEYWGVKKKDPKKAQAMIGGWGFKARKVDGSWMIFKSGDRIENPDIADCYNTVMKMAKKRAHVDAMITACAASDIFIQDLEDFTDESGIGSTQKSTKTAQKQGKNSEKSPEKSEKEKIKDPVRQDLINEIGEILKCGLFAQKEKDHIRDLISQTATNNKLVQIKQGCRQEADKRQAKQEEESGGQDPELERIASEGWEAAGEEPESGGLGTPA
jgi:hypothetical protein